MTGTITIDQMIKALRDLPSGAAIEDAIERLYFLAKIERGIAELDAGLGSGQDEVRKLLFPLR